MGVQNLEGVRGKICLKSNHSLRLVQISKKTDETVLVRGYLAGVGVYCDLFAPQLTRLLHLLSFASLFIQRAK